MENVMALEGPVLKVNGQLTLWVQLDGGAADRMDCTRGISEVQGEFLKIVIPEWLAGLLDIEEGDVVSVEADGKLNIGAASPRLVH